jgi:acetyl esterase/lipase
MPSDRRSTRRAYLLGVGALVAGAGCSESGAPEGSGTPTDTTTRRPTGTRSPTRSPTRTESPTEAATETETESPTATEQPETPPPTPDPEAPLAERYGVVNREAVYRETTDGQLRILAALPDGDGPFPLLVHVHGGAWRYGSAGYGAMETLAGAGIAVASVEYRLSGTATYPAPVRDLAAALGWLRANEGDWNVDPGRLALVGGSAGAHLGALLAANPTHPTFQPAGGVDGGVDLDAFIGHYGIYDVRLPNACEDRNLGPFLGEDCDSASVKAEASPITHVDGDHPPSLLYHGDADQLVPASVSRRYRDALRNAGISAEYHELAGVDHGYLEPANRTQREVRRETHRRMVTFLFEGPWARE